MQLFPSREIFLTIGSLSIRWYAVCILTGAVLAYAISMYEGKKEKYDSETYDDIFIGSLLFGILGARLWYVLFFNLKGYLANPTKILQIWDGGLAIQGGLIAGFLFAYVYCTIKRYSFFRLVDTVMPNVLLAQAFGRWGNFANGECFGAIVEESYYDGILSFIKNGMFIDGYYREPMFFYESTLCLLGFILIHLYLKGKTAKRGDGLFAYLGWYGAIRFWIESKRTDSLMWGNIRVAQLISIVFLAIGILGLLGVFRKLINGKKPAVIFDLDCTLVDTYTLICASFEHVFKKYLPEKTFTEQEKADFCGPTLEETFKRYFPEGNIDEMIDMYRKFNNEHHDEMVRSYENAKETIEYLIENHYPYAIASSKLSATIVKSLKAAGMDDLFEEFQIIGYEKATQAKPNPEVILIALKNINGSKDNAIYIGDSSSDIEAAKNAGVYAIAYCTNEYKRSGLNDAKPNRFINNLIELEDILKEEQTWTYNTK